MAFLLLIVALTSHSLSCFGHVSALPRNYPRFLLMRVVVIYLRLISVKSNRYVMDFWCSVLFIVFRSNDGMLVFIVCREK